MNVGVFRFDFHDGWVVHVIVMIVGNYDGVYGWNVLDLTGDLRVSLGPHPAARTTSFAEDRVEQDSKPARKLHKVAGVAKPCGT